MKNNQKEEINKKRHQIYQQKKRKKEKEGETNKVKKLKTAE